MDIKSPWSKEAWSRIPYGESEPHNDSLPEPVLAFYGIADQVEKRLNRLEYIVGELFTIEPMGHGDTEASEALQEILNLINGSQERLRQALHVLGDLEPLMEGDIETFNELRGLRSHEVVYEY